MSEAKKEIHVRIKRALQRTWDVIGSDMLTSLQEAGQAEEMTRDHVIEVVCDADHLESHGDDRKIVDVFRELVDVDRLAICKLAFPFESYSW